ncbi:MAG: transporter [Desulfofustis sp.]|jgi:hypothetical protein|nr:transporter [Desulfofustis sp.]
MITAMRTTALAALVAGLVCTTSGQAEEGGSGHYMPGSMSSFIDSIPQVPSFLARLNVIAYDGSADPTLTIPIARVLYTGIDATIMGYGLTMVWRPDIDLLGSGWSYAMSVTIPVITVDISAEAATPLRPGRSIDLDDSETGLGDIILQPVMISRILTPDFKINSRLTIYTPTGEYTAGKLANTGKNFWTFSPSVELMYFGQKNGIEASLFTGVDFNTENKDTDYTSGTQLHFDGTLAQHFPLWGGLAGAGINAYYYEQLIGDSGDGATLGDFKAMTTGLGPALSYSSKVGEHSVTGELKWLHEFETRNRLEGDTIFFKLLVSF